MRYRSRMLLPVVLLTGILHTAASAAVPPKKGTVFSSQGQAPYRMEERARSQKQAFQAFLTHGVTQALASLMGPSQSTEATRAAREKILKQPERYVETHKILSEGPSKGVYRISGQVTVNMEALKRDLRGSTTKPLLPEPPAKPPSESVQKPDISATPTGPVIGAAAPPARGIVLAKPTLFWAVAERWEDRWVLPENGHGRQSLFARTLLQETEDYDWTLTFPAPNAIGLDFRGDLPVDRVMELARQAGAQHAVVGSVATAQHEGRIGESSISLNVRLLEVRTGALLAEVHKETEIEDEALQDAVMKLAEAVAVQLDRTVQNDRGNPGEAQAKVTRSESVGRPGEEYVLTVRGERHFAAWEALQHALRTRYPTMEVRRVDVGTVETQVAIMGIETTFFNPSQELAPSPGFRVRVDQVSADARRIEVSVQGPPAGGATPTESGP